jgi:transposase InsO family protein
MSIPVHLNKARKPTHALLDSGAMGNFIHEELVERLGLTRIPRTPLPLIDVKGIKIGEIQFQVKVEMRMGAHEETIILDVAPIGSHRIILGLPWLEAHDPSVKWSTGHIQFDSQHCNLSCLPQPHDIFVKQTPITLEPTTPITRGHTDPETTNETTMEPDLVEVYAVDLMPTATEEELKKLIPPEYHDFLDVFDPAGPTRQLPPSRPGYDFEIPLDPTKPLPKPARPYHMSPAEREDWVKWRDTMLTAGLISRAPPNTPVAAPFFFVWKKDGTRRPVIDYRKLNDITLKDSYPLPRIDEMLERMQGSKIFSKFDLKMGYNQLRIKPEDVWKTAFMTPDGPFCSNVMTFGFAGAPPYFQRWMHDVLAPILVKQVENYLDDSGSHHKETAEHVAVNRELLQRFREHGLFANAKKCEFHQDQMEFLGVEVSSKGFEMEQAKVDAVREWKPPKTVRAVREFIGFCNFYRRFIKSFSEVARPLHDLTKEGQRWQWTEREQYAFEELKRRICESPILIHADPAKRFQMETDASNFAYGAVLSQKGEDGKHHPIAFHSKSMSPAERNYGISDKEALAIIKALQHWRHWLEGTKEPIRIITDHRNLEYFKNPRALNRRQLRWLEQLTHYNYEIAYRPGDKNSVADALSRKEEHKPAQSDEEAPNTLFDPGRFVDTAMATPMDEVPIIVEINEVGLTCTDEQLMERIREHTRHADPLTWPRGYELDEELVLVSRETGRIWVPPDEDLRRDLLATYHDGKIAGHLGASGTLELVSRKYWWTELPDFTRRYVQGCYTCARNKSRNQKPVGLLRPLPTPEGPWLWTQSDFITDLPLSRGFDAIYVIADWLTKMAHFIPCRSSCTAEQLAELHVQRVWPLHGLPLQHNTDRGPQFTAPYMRNLYRNLGIDQRLSTAYHPESQGQVESNNKWLETYLRMFSAYRQDDWADFLHTAEFAYNNHHHPSIGMTPFYANYGYHPVYTNRASSDQVLELPLRLQHVHEVQARCQLAIEKAQQVYKRYADRRRQDSTFAVGDKVWLESYNLSTDAPSKKLAAKRLGPYEVLELVGPASYRLSIPASWRVHSVFHGGLLSRTKEDTIPGRAPPPQPRVTMREQELWVIDHFVNSRWFRGKFQLKIRWEDQAEEQDDWRDYAAILKESAGWQEELGVRGEVEDDPIGPMLREYYDRHPGAPRHDDPPHRRAAPPRHRAVRRR